MDGYRGAGVIGLYQRQGFAAGKIVAGNAIGRLHRIRGSLLRLQKGDHTSLFGVCGNRHSVRIFSSLRLGGRAWQIDVEQLVERIANGLTGGERHALQRGFLAVRPVVIGVADDREILTLCLRAVAERIFHGDAVGKTGNGAAEGTGETAVIALRGGAGDGDLSRADDGICFGKRTCERTGIVRTGNGTQTVAVLYRSAAVARESAGAGAAGNRALRMAVIDVAGVVAYQTAGHGSAGNRAGGRALGDGAAVFAHEAAGHVRADDGSGGGALVDGACNREEGVGIGLALVQTHQTAGLLFAADCTGDGAAADEVCYVFGKIVVVQRCLRIAHQTADLFHAGDGYIFEVQILNLCALDDAEETYAVCAEYGDVGDGFVLSVKSAGKGLSGSADAGEGLTREVQIGSQLVVFVQRFFVFGIGQIQQLFFGRNGIPLDALAGEGIPCRTLEVVFGSALEPEDLIAILHRGKGGTDVGELIVDGEHPAVRGIDLPAVDGVDKAAVFRRGGIGIGQFALRLRGIHQIHQTGVAVGVHGDGDHITGLFKGIGVLIISGNGNIYLDLGGLGRFGGLDAAQVGQSVVVICILRPNAGLAAGEGGEERRRLHFVQRLAGGTIFITGAGGAVVVAVGNALGLVILECGGGLIAADETVALCTRNGDGTGGIAVFIDVALIDGTSHKTAGISPGGDISQSKAVFDGSAIAETHKAGGVGALGGDIHGGPAALNQAARLVSTHEARVANGGGGVGGEGAALHVAFANDAVVPADHAAQHRAGVGGDIGVHHSAMLNAAIVVVGEHSGIVGEKDVGAVNGQVMNIAGGTDVPEKTGVAVAEGQTGDLVSLSVKFAHEGIGDGADGLGFHLVRGGELGEINIIGEPIVFAPLHRLIAGGIGAGGGLVLHVGKGNPLLGGGNVHPFFFGGFFRAGGGMIHLAVCGGNTVGEPQFPVDGAVCNGGDGEGVPLLRGKDVCEVGGGVPPGNREGLEERVVTVLHRVKVDLIGAGEVFAAVPLCSGAVPLHTRDRFHAVVGTLNAHYLIVYPLGRDIGGLSVCLHSHGGIVDALGQCGKGGSEVIPGLDNIGNVLRKGQLRRVGTQIIISGQADDECRAVFHGSVPCFRLLRVAFRLIDSCVQCGKPCFLLGSSHTVDDRSFVYILQLFKVGEVGSLAADCVIFCLFFRGEGNPSFHHLPQRNGVALRTRHGAPLELCGGERGLIAVLGGDDAADKRGIGNQCYLGCGRGNILPLQHGQTVVDAPNGCPVLRAQFAEQGGLHFDKGESGSVADFRTLWNAAGEVVAVGQRIVFTGGKCTGGGGILAGNAACGIGIFNGDAIAAVNAGGIIFRGNGTRVVAIDNFGVAAVVAANDTGSAVFGRYAAGVIATSDCNYGIIILAVAQNATHIAATGDSRFVSAVGNGISRTGGTTGNAACIAAAGIITGNRTLHNHIFDLGIFNDAEKTGILGSDIQPGNGITLSVKAAGELVGVLADGGEGAAAQINIIGQIHIEFRNTGSIIDGIGQPCQLLTILNLIVGSLRAVTGGLGLGRAVPRSRVGQGNGNDLIPGNGEGFAHLGVALGFDRVGVFAVRELVSAVGRCINSLAVPSHRDHGVGVRRGDIESDIESDRALFRGVEGDGFMDRAAADVDAASFLLVAEGGDGIGIRAVGEGEGPLAAGMCAGLPINGDLGVLRGDGESDGVGGDLPTEDGVAVIDARRSGDERLAQRGGERLQFVGGFGCGVGVGAAFTFQEEELIQRGIACVVDAADHGGAAAGAGDLAGGITGGYRIFIRRRGVQIADDAARLADSCGNVAGVIAVVNDTRAIQLADDTADTVAAGDVAGIDAGSDGAVAVAHIADNARGIVVAGDSGFVDAIFDSAEATQLADDSSNAIRTIVGGNGNFTGRRKILHGAGAHHAKETIVITGGAGDFQVLNFVVLPVEGAVVSVSCILTNRCPILITKNNVICQLGTDAVFAAIVYLRGKPAQLAGIGDQIRVFHRACARGLFEHGNGDVLGVAFLGFRQVDGAALRDICRTVE